MVLCEKKAIRRTGEVIRSYCLPLPLPTLHAAWLGISGSPGYVLCALLPLCKVSGGTNTAHCVQTPKHMENAHMYSGHQKKPAGGTSFRQI